MVHQHKLHVYHEDVNLYYQPQYNTSSDKLLVRRALGNIGNTLYFFQTLPRHNDTKKFIVLFSKDTHNDYKRHLYTIVSVVTFIQQLIDFEYIRGGY